MTTRLVALLRGINVGGHNRLSMATLQQVAGAAGGTEVATYVQSGNLVVTTSDPGGFGDRLVAELTTVAGLSIPVITRSADEWRAAMAACPYAAQAAADATKVHLVCFPSAVVLAPELRPERFAPEELVVAAGARELYVHLPNGQGRSPLAVALSRSSATSAGTWRNWRTVDAISGLL